MKLFLAMLALLLCPVLATATTYDYRYTGNPFDTFNGDGNPYTSADYITVQILSDHLLGTGPANIANQVMSLTISDGRKSLTMGPNIDTVLNIWAVADYLPASWYVELVSDLNIMASMHEIFPDRIYAIDYAAEQLTCNPVYSFNMGPTGVWSLAVIPDPSPAPVPEPATALLLIAGLVAATGFHHLRSHRTAGRT